MQTRHEESKNAYRKARVSSLALMGAVLLIALRAGLPLMMNPESGTGTTSTPDQFDCNYIRYGLLALSVVGVLLTARISAAVNLSTEKLANPLPVLATHAAIVSCACFIVAVVGTCTVLTVTENITDLYIFLGLALALQVAFFPRFGRWEELAGPWIANPAPELDEQEEQTERQTVNPNWWKYAIGMGGVFLFGWLAIAFNRENAFEESYSLLLWRGFFPLTVIALLYFFFKVFPRLAAGEEYRRTRPAFKYLFGIIMSLLTGLILCVIARSSLVAAMDNFNVAPVKVEAIISKVGGSRDCRLELFFGPDCKICLQCRGNQPVRTPRELWQNKPAGQKVILVGRKSFAGTVIDEIRLPSDKAVEQTSSSATESDGAVPRAR